MNAACSHDRIDSQSQPRISSKDAGFSLDPNGLINQCNQVVEERKKKKKIGHFTHRL